MSLINIKYDNLIKLIKDKKKDQIPFCIYREPSSNNIKLIYQRDNSSNYLNDIGKDKGFLINNFLQREKCLLIKADEILFSQIDKDIDKNKNITNVNFDLNKSTYFDLFDKSMDAIESRGIKKLVISHILEIENPDLSYEYIFSKLVSSYKNAFVYLLYHKDIGVWAGASPELLLSANGLDINTVALAGTKEINQNISNNIWTNKEIIEHKFVVDYIMDVFSNINFRNLVISSKENYKISNLVHIKTNFSANIYDKKDIKVFLELMHPSPAVCGCPKQEAIEFIQRNETHNREIYTGFLGEINIEKKIKLFVNIRCFKILESYLRFYTGTGITSDSSKDDEWNEIILKFKSIKDIIF